MGLVINLTGPLNKSGEYKAHVLVDIEKSLVHQVKVTILNCMDRETIKLNLYGDTTWYMQTLLAC